MQNEIARLGTLAFVVWSVILHVGCDQRAVQPSSAEKIKKLIGDYELSVKEFQERFSKATTDDERMQLGDEYPEPEPVAQSLIALVESQPEAPSTRPALYWIVNNGTGRVPTPDSPE